MSCTVIGPRTSLLALGGSLIEELLLDLQRTWQVARRCGPRQVVRLAIVKAIDYSDQLPVALTGTALRSAPAAAADLHAMLQIGLLGRRVAAVAGALRAHWRLLERRCAQVSYPASRGRSEAHLHITRLCVVRARDGRRRLRARYYDYEAAIWQVNPTRTPSFTVAEICADLESSAAPDVRYYRVRAARVRRFERRRTLALLDAALD